MPGCWRWRRWRSRNRRWLLSELPGSLSGGEIRHAVGQGLQVLHDGQELLLLRLHHLLLSLHFRLEL